MPRHIFHLLKYILLNKEKKKKIQCQALILIEYTDCNPFNMWLHQRENGSARTHL